MFVPVHLDILQFFYPIGNTPATCFTRNLAREERGDILLLGCGDVRNILFTLHSEQNNSRHLDITCCDIEDAVIARNILLFSLIIADTDGKHQQMIWNIYYHFYLDQISLQFLNNQARELLSLSTSMDAWHETLYGRILRFCDLATFTRVRALWKSYCMQDLNKKSRAVFDCLLEASIKRAQETREYFVGSKYVTTGIRSAAPAGLAYVEDAHESYQHYWKHGSTNHDPETLSETNLPNPLFALHTTGAPTLHYGTDPLLGFHLATAFAPVKSTLAASVDPTRTSLFRVVEAARLQFREWCDAFRSSFRSDLSIRFFTGDAIAFAHALHQLKLSKSRVSRLSYRNAHNLDPIELYEKEYAATHGAPFTFNVIDTSNLIDHVGGLNLLSATSPLLRSNVSSTLYTESLVKREKDHRAYIDTLLCGDFATISLLLDLFPIEYWTNSSSTSTADDVMFDMAHRMTGSDESRQMHVKLTWKRSGLLSRGSWGATERKLRIDESDLAHVLHRVYRNMFQHEDMLSLFKGLDAMKLQRNSTVHYHRGSFVFFLRLVKSRVAVDWPDLMNRILELIENDSTITMGLNYIQELYLYLHTLGLYSASVLTRTISAKNPSAGGLSGWMELPGTVWITLQVPRNMLGALTGPMPTEIGTPISHCIVQSSPRSTVGRWQNIFSGIQVTFGTITTVGKVYSNDYALQVAEDNLRWQGESPLVVSFETPTWFLLLEPQTAIVAFGLQSTPLNCTKFVQSFGIEMKIFETTLGNEDHVHISRYPPNLSKTTFGLCLSGDEDISNGPVAHDFKTAFSARVVQAEGRIAALSGRLDFVSEKLKSSLTSGCVVNTKQTAPCDLAITLTGGNAQILLPFPVPVCGNKSKIRIARRSAYIEIEAPLGSSPWTSLPAFFPSHAWVDTHNIHRIDMSTLPVLDHNRHSQLQWLSPHVACMFSGEERRLRELSNSTASVLRSDARVSFKDSMFSLFMHFTGLQGGRSHIFGLDNPTGGGIQILIFVSSMRLDLGSQTVVLDTAVLPLTKSLVPRIVRFLRGITEKGLCHIKVDNDEIKLWRQTLPSFAERCRVWHHYRTCDHVTKFDRRTQDGDNDIFCPCSRGSLPQDFMPDVPNWADVAGLVTRAAISPIFSVPIVAPPFEGSLTSGSAIGRCVACGKEEAVGGGKLLKCSACHIAKYCSSSCQRSDWKSHKRSCRLIK